MADLYVVIDLEATCEKDDKNFFNEIIEFPAVVISSKTKKVLGGRQTHILHSNLLLKINTYPFEITKYHIYLLIFHFEKLTNFQICNRIQTIC